jgi:hypothetical protein
MSLEEMVEESGGSEMHQIRVDKYLVTRSNISEEIEDRVIVD